MSANHTTTVKLAQIEASRRGWRLLANAVGLGWIGRVDREWLETRKGGRARVVQLLNPARIKYGLVTGSFDLVGWRPLLITADMVGRTVAQFATVDAKTAGYSRMSLDQKMWSRNVREAGGFAGVAVRREGGVEIEEIG